MDENMIRLEQGRPALAKALYRYLEQVFHKKLVPRYVKQGATDDEIIATAKKYNAMIITQDADFLQWWVLRDFKNPVVYVQRIPSTSTHFELEVEIYLYDPYYGRHRLKRRARIWEGGVKYEYRY